MIATCGGELTVENLPTASCVGLDLEKKLWDENLIGDLTKIRSGHAAVSMENIGTYLIGGNNDGDDFNKLIRTTEFLAEGKKEWTVGPTIPVDMDLPCAVSISSQSFLAIGNTGIREYKVDINDPTSMDGWQSEWPELNILNKKSLSCSKIGNSVVIAGGYFEDEEKNWTYQSSTEVLDLTTRKVLAAGDMISPRAQFIMATITRDRKQMIMAFGGAPDEKSFFTAFSEGLENNPENYFGENSVEQFDPDTKKWTLLPTKMESPRENMGGVAVLQQLVCPTQ